MGNPKYIYRSKDISPSEDFLAILSFLKQPEQLRRPSWWKGVGGKFPCSGSDSQPPLYFLTACCFTHTELLLAFLFQS